MRTKKTVEKKMTDTDLNITDDDIKFCRHMIAVYDAKALKFKAKALAAPTKKKGAYISHQRQSEKAASRMVGNLAFQLEWLKRHRPKVYDEVK